MNSKIIEQNVKLTTTCETELFAGFFGINAYGHQPECTQEIEIEVEEYEQDDDGTIRPTCSVLCPCCGATLEWPHGWEIEEVYST